MKKNIYIIVSLICSYCQGQTGYFGKRFILKTNAFNGIYKPFRSADAEYMVSKNISLNLIFEQNRKEIPNNTYSNYWKSYLSDDLMYSDFLFPVNEPLIYSYTNLPNPKDGIKTLKKSEYNLNVNRFSIGFKYYFKQTFKSPPVGFYINSKFAISKKTIEGGSYLPNNIIRYDSIDAVTSKVFHSYEFYSQFYQEGKSETTRGTEFLGGIGYQFIIRKLICLDLNFTTGLGFYSGSTLNKYNLVGNVVSTIYNYEDNYYLRNNIGNFDPFTGGLNSPDKETTLNLYFNIKLGFLIF